MNLHCISCNMTFSNLEGQSYENFDEDYPPVCPICNSGMDLQQVGGDAQAYKIDYSTMQVIGLEPPINELPPVPHHNISVGKYTFTPEQYLKLEQDYQQSLHNNY